MTSSFLISYPDVPAQSMYYSSTRGFNEDYPVENTFYGQRPNFAQLDTAFTGVTIYYDLGTGNSRTVDHFILGNVYGAWVNGMTSALLKGSSDNSTFNNQLGTTASFQTRTFSGPNSRDVIFTPTFNDDTAGSITAYRYFSVTFGGANAGVPTFSNQTFPVSKIYFGAFFDMGKEPDYFTVEAVSDDVDTWRYPRGNIMMTSSSNARHRIVVEWDCVTDAKVQEFQSKILYNPVKNLVFLYTKTYTDPLFGKTLIHAKVLPESVSIIQTDQDVHTVSVTFEEVI